jgi:magnesium chelatase subunit D
VSPQAAAVPDAPRPSAEAMKLALDALRVLAVDPQGLGGAVLRGSPSPVRDAWIRALQSLMPAGSAMRRLPLHVSDERLLGGLDLAASLSAGRAIAQSGVLAAADGGVLVCAMAERMAPATVAHVAAALDRGEVAVQRDGLSRVDAARFACIVLDEGAQPEEAAAAALRDRLGLHIPIDEVPNDGTLDSVPPAQIERVERARRALPNVTASDDIVQALCAAADALGIVSVRAAMHALHAARALAALDGHSEVKERHAACAAALVLAHRATVLPAGASAAEDAPPPEVPTEKPAEKPPEQTAEQAAEQAAEPPPSEPPADDAATPPLTTDAMQDLLIAAAAAAIPPGLLALLRAGRPTRSKAAAGGRSGAWQQATGRGRPAGVRAAAPSAGQRLHLIETLRAAAPWQRLRREALPPHAPKPRLAIRASDFRVIRYRQRRTSTTLFVVDASGSAALNRLAEAKGAVELLLADCYVRRDRVALIGFRGAGAELLLPPTRSLVRAKRSLAGLPGGGGTPLAHAIDAAGALADAVARRGETPTAVFLTDGRANIALDGTPGRAKATEDATAAARRFCALGHDALWLDTAPQPQAAARELALAMGARYVALPYAAAADMSRVVRAATASR